jgi:hypothetical protein
MLLRPILSLLVVTLIDIGCDAQVDSDYPGEPLAEVVGTIRNEMSAAPPEAVVALIWVNSASTPDVFVGESVPASAHFPADFSMKLYDVPPDEILGDFTEGGQYPRESRIGMAYISVAIPDANGEVVLDPEEGGPLIGLAEEYVLAYVEQDVAPDTYCEALLHGQLEAGYHLLEVIRQSDAEVQDIMDCRGAATTREERIACGIPSSDLFQAAPQGMKTRVPVRLVDDPSVLDGANLK